MMNFLIRSMLWINDVGLQISDGKFSNHTAMRYVSRMILLLRSTERCKETNSDGSRKSDG
jgi:hypothetical protein